MVEAAAAEVVEAVVVAAVAVVEVVVVVGRSAKIFVRSCWMLIRFLGLINVVVKSQ